MDDETGWNEILVDGWGPAVRDAVCERVEEHFGASRGVLAHTAADPEDAPRHATERVHLAVVEAIAAETGADLDALGSQAAWATYDDVWAELGRRAVDPEQFETVPGVFEEEVADLLSMLPMDAVEHAGALFTDEGWPLLVRRDDRAVIDVEGLFRWLATSDEVTPRARDRAHAIARLARSG